MCISISNWEYGQSVVDMNISQPIRSGSVQECTQPIHEYMPKL